MPIYSTGGFRLIRFCKEKLDSHYSASAFHPFVSELFATIKIHPTWQPFLKYGFMKEVFNNALIKRIVGYSTSFLLEYLGLSGLAFESLTGYFSTNPVSMRG